MLAEGERAQLPLITVHQGHGGSFEIHELGSGWAGINDGARAAGDIALAGNALQSGAIREALNLMTVLVQKDAYHSEALSMLAHAHAAAGDHGKALEACQTAVRIEPNRATYRGQQVWHALNGPARAAAVEYFQALSLRFPGLRDYDYCGVLAYLGVGALSEARDLLAGTALPVAQRDECRALLDKAARAHQQYAEIEERVLASPEATTADPGLVPALEAVHAGNPRDPYVQVNLGLALARCGDHRRAVGLLMAASGGMGNASTRHCWSNAAYSLLAIREWATGLHLLQGVMESLAQPVAPCDVPGVATWISDSGLAIESSRQSAAGVLEAALAECPDTARVTPEILRMLALLKEWEAQLASKASPGIG